MTTHRSYTPEEAREVLPQVRSILLQVAVERRSGPSQASALGFWHTTREGFAARRPL
jgi:hypothetical protein